jgi:hypothetical protein
MVKPETPNSEPHRALRAAFLENLETRPVERAKLVPGRHIVLRYDPPTHQLSFEFKAVVRSPRGSGDVIQQVYSTFYSPDGQSQIPFSDRDHRCTKDNVPTEIPFLFAASELSCSGSQQLGDAAALSGPGIYRLVITFETDDKKGHTIQYCFPLNKSALTQPLLSPLGFRRFNFALCGGGETQ